MTATLTVTPQLLVDFLESLGSADAIAEFFETEGIKGRRGSAGSCPISEYTKQQVPGCDWASAGFTLGYGRGSEHAEWAVVRAHATNFMRAFDHGQYPNLVA